jgi:uncharacterized phiE125 gp8 family phage protein
MYLARTVAPSGPILTLAEAKAQLRIPFTDEDDLITSYIALATEYLEGFNGRAGYLGRALLTQTFELRLDEFPPYTTPVAVYPMGNWPSYSVAAPIVLPMPPLQSVTSVQYLDSTRTLQTMDPSTYIVETAMLQGRITLPQSQAWPTDVAVERDAVRITFVAGYGADESALPAGIKQAAKLLVGMYYINREGGTDTKGGFGFALDALLSQHRIPGF